MSGNYCGIHPKSQKQMFCFTCFIYGAIITPSNKDQEVQAVEYKTRLYHPHLCACPKPRQLLFKLSFHNLLCNFQTVF